MIKVIFIIGLEGSGHRMLRDVMSPLFRKRNFLDEPKEIFFFLRDFNKFKKKDLHENYQKIKKFVIDYKNSSVYLSPSYPFGRKERFQNIPTLSEAIFWLHSNFKNKIEIKIIHLDRSIQESALSAYGRGYSKKIKQACRHLYKSALVLEEQIINLKKKFKIIKIDYHSFVKNPKVYCLKLSKHLNFEIKFFMLENVYKNKRIFKIKDILIVKNFFKNKKFLNIENRFNNLLTKPKIFIYHHMGLGDFISCNAIIRKLCKQRKEVFLFCKRNLKRNVEFMYRDLHNLYLISIKDETEIEYFFKSINLEKKNYQIIELGFDNFYKTIKHKLKNKNFTTDMVFYKQLNIPYSNRFTKTFWKRDLINEKRVYKKLNPHNKKYIFIHEDPERNLEIRNLIKPRKKIKVIQNDKSEIIFNLGLILEKAEEIHLIESSIRHLIETLKIKHNKIYLYNIRKNLSRGPFLDDNGNYIGTNRKFKIINSVKDVDHFIKYDALKKSFSRKFSKLFNLNEKKFVSFKR